MSENLINQRHDITTESYETCGVISKEQAFLRRICMLLFIGSVTLLPGNSQSLPISSLESNTDRSAMVEHEIISKRLKKLIKMTWKAIQEKLSKMSKNDALEMLETLSIFNDDIAELLGTDIDAKISNKNTLNNQEKTLLLRLANRYEASSNGKLSAILSKNEKPTEEESTWLKSFYKELCQSIMNNATKYSSAQSFLHSKQFVPNDNADIEKAISDFGKYIGTLK
ncbi:hypothetical protein JW758_03890 [Candidatus Peregrinibacteria bacterium]|nr:hypothetical protein [Candidatus Peregrinibacteria bacterium]